MYTVTPNGFRYQNTGHHKDLTELLRNRGTTPVRNGCSTRRGPDYIRRDSVPAHPLLMCHQRNEKTNLCPRYVLVCFGGFEDISCRVKSVSK